LRESQPNFKGKLPKKKWKLWKRRFFSKKGGEERTGISHQKGRQEKGLERVEKNLLCCDIDKRNSRRNFPSCWKESSLGEKRLTLRLEKPGGVREEKKLKRGGTLSYQNGTERKKKTGRQQNRGGYVSSKRIRGTKNRNQAKRSYKEIKTRSLKKKIEIFTTRLGVPFTEVPRKRGKTPGASCRNHPTAQGRCLGRKKSYGGRLNQPTKQKKTRRPDREKKERVGGRDVFRNKGTGEITPPGEKPTCNDKPVAQQGGEKKKKKKKTQRISAPAQGVKKRPSSKKGLLKKGGKPGSAMVQKQERPTAPGRDKHKKKSAMKKKKKRQQRRHARQRSSPHRTLQRKTDAKKPHFPKKRIQKKSGEDVEHPGADAKQEIKPKKKSR